MKEDELCVRVCVWRISRQRPELRIRQRRKRKIEEREREKEREREREGEREREREREKLANGYLLPCKCCKASFPRFHF